MASHLSRPGRDAFPSTTYHPPQKPASPNPSPRADRFSHYPLPKEKTPGNPGDGPFPGHPSPRGERGQSSRRVVGPGAALSKTRPPPGGSPFGWLVAAAEFLEGLRHPPDLVRLAASDFVLAAEEHDVREAVSLAD